ncbi:MAG: acyl carrier protein [Muribaculaceae bacterium]|nr:acyl carrier protein [Muribaculaceae bacterium]
MSKSNKVKKIIAETLHIPTEAVTDELGIGLIPQWDSMGNMAVIAALEEQLAIEFPIEELFELNSVRAIIEGVEKIS